MAVVGYIDGYVDGTDEYGLADTEARTDISAIKDGTNIDSFGDVETALGDKVTKLVAGGVLGTDGSPISVETPLTLSNGEIGLMFGNIEEGVQTSPPTAGDVYSALAPKANTSDVNSKFTATVDLLKDTTGWLGGNRAKITRTGTASDNGVAYTVNADNTVTANGATTGSSSKLSLNVGDDAKYDLVAGEKIVLSGGVSDKIRLNLFLVSNPNTEVLAGSTPVEWTVPTTGQYILQIYINTNTTVDNVTLYPMILTPEQYALNPSYRPYHESVEEEIQDIYKVYSKMGAKNLYRQVAYSTSGTSGIITDNGNGTYTFSGTTLATTYCVINTRNTNLGEKAKVSAGIYKFKCFETTPPDGVSVTLSIKKNASAVTLLDTYRGVDPVVIEITSDDYYQDGAQLQYTFTQSNGKTTSGYTVKPMLYDASITDNAYQPPTFTNLELTEKALSFKGVIANNTDFNNFSDDGQEGIYNCDGATGLTNIPSDFNGYGKFVFLKYGGQRMHIIVANGAIYTRVYAGSAWRNWFKYAGTEMV